MKNMLTFTVLTILSFSPLQSKQSDISQFGHIVANHTNHPIHAHLDISGGSDLEEIVEPQSVWKTGKSGTVNSLEVRDYESGMLVKKVKPNPEDKYQIFHIRPGEQHDQLKESTTMAQEDVKKRYKTADVKATRSWF